MVKWSFRAQATRRTDQAGRKASSLRSISDESLSRCISVTAFGVAGSWTAFSIAWRLCFETRFHTRSHSKSMSRSTLTASSSHPSPASLASSSTAAHHASIKRVSRQSSSFHLSHRCGRSDWRPPRQSAPRAHAASRCGQSRQQRTQRAAAGGHLSRAAFSSVCAAPEAGSACSADPSRFQGRNLPRAQSAAESRARKPRPRTMGARAAAAAAAAIGQGLTRARGDARP